MSKQHSYETLAMMNEIFLKELTEQKKKVEDLETQLKVTNEVHRQEVEKMKVKAIVELTEQKKKVVDLEVQLEVTNELHRREIEKLKVKAAVELTEQKKKVEGLEAQLKIAKDGNIAMNKDNGMQSKPLHEDATKSWTFRNFDWVQPESTLSSQRKVSQFPSTVVSQQPQNASAKSIFALNTITY